MTLKIHYIHLTVFSKELHITIYIKFQRIFKIYFDQIWHFYFFTGKIVNETRELVIKREDGAYDGIFFYFILMVKHVVIYEFIYKHVIN